MDQLTYQVAAGFVWPTVGHPGRVPFWAIVPNGSPAASGYSIPSPAQAETCGTPESLV